MVDGEAQTGTAIHGPTETDEVPTGSEQDLRHVVRDGVASQVMATLTGGPFLVAFALALGADALLVGVLASITALAQVVQIPGVWIVERFRDRRRITIVAAGVSRTFWIAIAAAPFLAGPWVLSLVVVAFLVHSLLGGIAGTAWNSWMRDLVPEGRVGSFFSHRMMIMILVGTPLLLAAGWLVDGWFLLRPQDTTAPYSILFVVGAVAGLLGLIELGRTSEPTMARQLDAPHWGKTLSQPLRNENFRHLVHFLVAWNFAVNLSAPFFMVYMLEQIGLSLGVVIVMVVISQLSHAWFLRLWGRYADHYGHRSILALSGPLFLLTLFLWTFTTFPGPTSATLPLLVLIHIGTGASMAGFMIASNNLALKLAPRGRATAYLATTSTASALAAGIAPLLGGGFIEAFVDRRLSLTLDWDAPESGFSLPTLTLEQWDFFFVFAILVGVYALHRLTAVHEEGRIHEKVLLGAMLSDVRQEMRNFSSVAGLRGLIQFPLTLLRRSREDGEVPVEPKVTRGRV